MAFRIPKVVSLNFGWLPVIVVVSLVLGAVLTRC